MKNDFPELLTRAFILPEEEEEKMHFLEAVLNQVPALVYLRDSNTRGINWCNETVARSFGYTRREVVAMGEDFFKRIAHPDDFYLSAYSSNYYKANEQNFGGVVRIRPVYADDWRWFIGISTIFTRNGEGKPLETLCVFMDFTGIMHADTQMNGVIGYVLSLHYQNVFEKLTPREKEIIRLLIQGYNNADIAAALYLSRHTVEAHRRNIRNKLDVKNTSELIALARKLGI